MWSRGLLSTVSSWIAGSVYRWVQRFPPRFAAAARCSRRPVGDKWRVDELDVRLNGTWTYIYRAIDQHGQVIDAYFSERRNAAAARTCFERAMAETTMGVRESPALRSTPPAMSDVTMITTLPIVTCR